MKRKFVSFLREIGEYDTNSGIIVNDGGTQDAVTTIGIDSIRRDVDAGRTCFHNVILAKRFRNAVFALVIANDDFQTRDDITHCRITRENCLRRQSFPFGNGGRNGAHLGSQRGSSTRGGARFFLRFFFLCKMHRLIESSSESSDCS